MPLRVIAVIPALNVERVVATRVIDRVPRDEVNEILLVDDGSTDSTAEVARVAGATVLCHGYRRGVGAAIRSGICYAKAHGFDAIIVLNAQGKYDPAHLKVLLAPLHSGSADLVQGSRYLPGGIQRRMPTGRSMGTLIYSTLFSFLVDHHITDATSGIRAFRVDLTSSPGIDLEQSWLDRYELEPYLLWKALELGYRVIEAPISVQYPEKRSDYTRMRPVVDWLHLGVPLLVMLANRLYRGRSG